jgi:hypothetical protein
MRSPNRIHDRESFFKYTSANAAEQVLKNCSVRWSSPVLFNDPFDVPRELSFGIDSEQIVRAMVRRMASLIEQPPDDTSDLNPRLRVVIDLIKRGVPDSAKAKMLTGLQDLAETLRPSSDSMDVLRTLWRQWLPEFRILCLTESPAHAAMWYHYADQYRGVVLELRCADQHDSAWLQARPVTYPHSKPHIYTADGWAELITLANDKAVRTMIDAATFTKAPDWEYEAEWRMTTKKRAGEVGDCSYYSIHPDEVGGIYFGPRISPADRDTITKLAARYPSAKLWDVSIGMSRSFDFVANAK